MNKLFLWRNCEADSDFTAWKTYKPIVMPNSSNAHSGGLVVIAENEQEALQLAKQYAKTNKYFIDNDSELESKATPVILDLSKKGVILYCDGDC